MVHRATRPQCKRRPQPRGDSSIESEVEDNIEQDLFSLGASSHSYIGDEQPETDRKQRIRLDESVEHQLILDIDEAGGIKSAFSLVDICNSREHLFGAPSSPQRVRIQKRVDYWKSYPERYYFRRRDLGIRTVSAKKHQPQSPHVKAPVPNRREHKPFSPSPKKPPGANTSSGRPCRRQKEDFDLDRDERDRDEHDRDEHDRNEQFLHRFSELKLNMASARFSLANDLAVDPETKDRVRDSNFDEVVTIDASLLEAPTFMRCGVLFQALRNHPNRLRSLTADGLLVNCFAMNADYVDGKFMAYLLSTNEVLIKQPFLPNTAVVTRYAGLFEQSHHACVSHMLAERQEHRRSHYILFKFPSSYQLENLYSRNTTSSKIDSAFAWYGSPEMAQFPAIACVQWPLALTNTKQRVKLSDSFGAETAEARAAREAWERANAGAAAGGGTSFTID